MPESKLRMWVFLERRPAPGSRSNVHVCGCQERHRVALHIMAFILSRVMKELLVAGHAS